MDLFQFFNKYSTKLNILERAFIADVFFPDYGENGLLKIEPQVSIYNDSTGENYFIDFVLTTSSGKYAIETDGLYYHASGAVDKAYYDKLQRKQNEIGNQGYRIIRFTSTNIQTSPADAKYELRRALIADDDMIKLRQGQSGTIKPHEIQQEALEALDNTRDKGNSKALVAIATGVGKTYLSAFDVDQFKASTVLFVVHINEILRQSRVSFEDVLFNRKDEMGFFYGNSRESSQKIVFASIQSLSEKNIHQFKPDYFDYIIVDETHHVAAPSYIRVFDYFKPKFFLGLTATPDRMDKKDILSHFDNNLVYEIDQKTAITKGMLVPYKYFGFKDDIDYSNIAWNGYRYNVNDLNKALMIERRDQAILDKYNEYCAGKKTIGFCVSIEHAEWMAKLFNDNGIKAVSIHSDNGTNDSKGPEYLENEERIRQFRNGKYEAAFVVNMFNEGVDIKDVECLLFLRPTESKTVFIQQMGRGLRISPNKKDVIILDFIGNYKTATSILAGLGIGNLGNLERKETDDRQLKLLYHYDNNGSEVYFQDEVVDVLRELKARESKEVDYELIDSEWEEYAEFAKKASLDNLYFKIGQQNKHIPVQLEALEVLSSNKNISEDDFKIKMDIITKNKYPDTSMQAGFRGLMISKVLGLLENTHPLKPSQVFEEIRSKTIDHDFKNSSQYDAIITRQLEKLSYWNPIFGNFNKYRKQNDRVTFNVFQNYPVLFINLVVFELRNQYGYKDARLSKEEFDFFIIFAQKLEEYKMIAELISRYRQYDERPELRKMLKESVQKADSRIYTILDHIRYYECNQAGIKIKDSYVESLENDINYIKSLIEQDKIITFEKNGDLYLTMLYSCDSFVDFHKSHQASF